MEQSLAELATYFRSNYRLPDQDLARLTAAARATGSRWGDIAAACGIETCKDPGDIIDRATGDTGAKLGWQSSRLPTDHTV
jgi:hypothetical protein